MVWRTVLIFTPPPQFSFSPTVQSHMRSSKAVYFFAPGRATDGIGYIWLDTPSYDVHAARAQAFGTAIVITDFHEARCRFHLLGKALGMQLCMHTLLASILKPLTRRVCTISPSVPDGARNTTWIQKLYSEVYFVQRHGEPCLHVVRSNPAVPSGCSNYAEVFRKWFHDLYRSAKPSSTCLRLGACSPKLRLDLQEVDRGSNLCHNEYAVKEFE